MSRAIRSAVHSPAMTRRSSRPTKAASITERLDRLPIGGFHVALIVAVFTGLAFDHMDQVVLSFVIPRYRQEWGLSAELASLNPMTGLGMTFVGALFWGMVADHIGRKRTLIATLALFSATMAINGFAWSFPQLVITCMVMGFGVGGTIPLSFTLLAEYTPAKYRGMAMVLVGVLSLVGGYLIASGSALLLVDTHGWRSLFLVGLAPAVLLPVIAWLVPESPRYLLARGRVQEAAHIVERLEARAGVRQATRPSDVRALAATDGREPEVATQEHGGEGALSFRDIGRLWQKAYRRRTAMLWTYAFAFGFFTFGFLTWLPTVLKQAGFEEGAIHLYATIMDLFAIPAALLTAVLFFSWSTKRTLALYPAVAGLAMVVFSALVWSGALTAASLLLVGGVVFAFGTILLGIFGPYATEVYPTDIRGTGSGWATGMSRFGALAAIPVGGLLLGAGVPLFVHQLVFGVPLLLAAVIMAALGIETRQRRLEEIAGPTAGATR